MSKIKMCLLALSTILFTNTVSADQSYYSNVGQVKIMEINPSDNWVKLFNTGNTAVDLAGWALYDENDTHELFITIPDIIDIKSINSNFGLLLEPKSSLTINGKNDTDFMLHKEGGEVRLYSGPVEIEGVLQDKIIYSSIGEGKSFKISDFGSVGEDVRYEIPENDLKTNEKIAVINDNIRKSRDEKKESDTRDKKDQPNSNRSNFNHADNSINPDMTGDEESQSANNNYSKNNTFTASSGLVKSNENLIYRLWNSWFLWKIILPMVGLWAALYGAAYFLKKRYLS